MHFTKLRLHGFKSFVDPTELSIDPGLTGIVGPNGCGKSNLVEALQWVMGEASARRLRGGDMDDVIFGGTTTRPSRNIASVTLHLDNTDQATAPLGEVEIDRRIDRGKGSTYRVNGKEARARDVQILFADAASGSQSASLIGQGRIGWLINARATERRGLLEEAAGIGGLQARRHEAELKLSAAEANLVRLRDAQTGLVAQIDRLKKQARQAERYRRLADQLRAAEVLLLHRRWLEQAERLRAVAVRLALVETRAAEAATAADAADQARRAAQEALPPVRDQAVIAAREVERLAGALLMLEAEQRRVSAAIEDGRRRLLQADQDVERETGIAADAAEAFQRLNAELAGLRQEQIDEAATHAGAAERLRVGRAALAACEAALNEATSRAAGAEAARQAAQKRLAAAEERTRRLQRQCLEAEAKLRESDLLSVSPEQLSAAEAEVAGAEAALTNSRTAIEQAEQTLKHAEQVRQALRGPAQEAERRAVMLRAEIDALRRLVTAGMGKGFAPILDDITVPPGFETALGAALGDDLLAATDAAAPICWSVLPEVIGAPEALPEGAEPIASSVEAPPAMARRLVRIGLVADAETGRRLQPLLRPGQRLVSRDGAAWRWDGLTIAAGAPTAAAVRLEQRNRLRQIESLLDQAQAELATAQQRERTAIEGFEAGQRHERAMRAAQLEAAQQAARQRQAHLALMQRHGQAQARQQAAADLHARLSAELADSIAQAAEAQREQQGLPDAAAGRAAVERLRIEAIRLREAQSEHQRHFDMLARDAAVRVRRVESIGLEAASWRQREQATVAHRATLTERQAVLQAELAALADRPAALAAEHRETEAALAEARVTSAAAETGLKRAEAVAAEAERQQSAAQNAHAAAREDRARAEAAHDQAVEAKNALDARITEPFDGADTEETTSEIETRIERLRREREAIGPVNLMAEAEMAELSVEVETIRVESEDLVGAIARLRTAIQELNREGRQRLLKAFDAVNEHFQALFVQLFGGGRAYLELTQSDGDPLSAGLEIMASPPGKKLQILSLLSGGERALTALALIFAVFLTNPAPVCVLDEVDAPLDDANVERFCSLVREIARRAETRFLIVTHHRVTMARMDRLYGVTMMERGISQLVSVELQTAERLRQTA